MGSGVKTQGSTLGFVSVSGRVRCMVLSHPAPGPGRPKSQLQIHPKIEICRTPTGRLWRACRDLGAPPSVPGRASSGPNSHTRSSLHSIRCLEARAECRIACPNPPHKLTELKHLRPEAGPQQPVGPPEAHPSCTKALSHTLQQKLHPPRILHPALRVADANTRKVPT